MDEVDPKPLEAAKPLIDVVAPDYLEDENGEVLTDDDGNPWLELA